MRCSMLIATVILLTNASCARPTTPPGSVLAQELSGRIAGTPQSCVSSVPNQNLRVINQSTLAYGDGRTIYVNHLPGPCPGLGPLNTLIVDVQSGHYCRGDRVRGLETGAIIPGPSCNLGDWTPYRTP
jgi:hypothetical protein